MEDEIAQLGLLLNTIVSRIENAATSEYTSEEYASWFDVDSSQPTETGEPSAYQIAEIDLTSVLCLDNPHYKENILTRPEKIYASLYQAALNKDETSPELGREHKSHCTRDKNSPGDILSGLDKDIDVSLSAPALKMQVLL